MTAPSALSPSMPSSNSAEAGWRRPTGLGRVDDPGEDGAADDKRLFGQRAAGDDGVADADPEVVHRAGAQHHFPGLRRPALDQRQRQLARARRRPSWSRGARRW